VRALNIKLYRDLWRLWAQVLAIALVIAGGVASLVMAVGSYRSLEETRNAYYERYQFADVFASVKRAPKSLTPRIAEIPGVAAVETRISRFALLDIPHFDRPATGQFISLPESGQPVLNQLYLRVGRTPESGNLKEVVINEGFAKAHHYAPGVHFSAILNGRKHDLVVVGIALSPEFIYAISPGEIIIPDDHRFAIVWMSEAALANVYDLEDAFSSLTLRLAQGASQAEVINRLDALLDRYGGTSAYGRKYQPSHAVLDHELDQLRSMSQTLPPIFLLVAAFLVNLTLTRMVAIEREQIGLLKAVGYGNFTIALHYAKFVFVNVLTGLAIGAAAGSLLGVYITRLLGDYFHFPFLVFIQSTDLYVIAAGLSLSAAVLGAVKAIRDIVRMPPAVAMQPPTPPVFRRLLPVSLSLNRIMPQSAVMMVRNISHHPVRAFFTTLGMALATSILVVSLFTNDTMEHLIDVTFFQSDRQDATISFAEKHLLDAVNQVGRLPGVLAAEPSRAVPVRIRYGSIERRLMISGISPGTDLNRIIDVNLRPVTLPGTGLAISDMLARILGVNVGDLVEVDLLEGQHRTVLLPIAVRVEDYFGMRGMMDANALSRLMREAPAVNSVQISIDPNKQELLFDRLKNMPAVSGIALQRISLVNFRETMALVVTTMAGIYTGLAATIAFGVVYNSARISLSERARELASLRILGFTQGEVLRMLLLELAIFTLLAQPPGWLIGYGLAWIMRTNLAGELMRVPLIIENFTYAFSSAVVIAAASLSALIVRRRINRLDLVSVLKTRD